MSEDASVRASAAPSLPGADAKDRASRARRLRAAAERAVSAACLAAAGFAAVRMAWHGIAVARSAAEGWPRSAAFAAIALLLVLGPGLAVLRLERERLSFLDSVLKTLAAGLGASGLALWLLLLTGTLTKASVAAWLALCAASVLAAAADALRRPGDAARRLAAAVRDEWRGTSTAGRIGFAVAALFLCGCFENAFGRPFESWDSLVSWDKWAADFAGRRSLGGYLTGGYTLFLPLVHSAFYRMAGSAGDVLPVEQLLLHGFCCLYPAILLLSLRSAGRRFGFSGFAAFVFFAAGKYVACDFAIGHADVPLVAMAAAAVALVGRGGGARLHAALSATALFFAVAFMKGNGVVWGLAAAVVCARSAPPGGARRVWIPFLAAVAACLPFFAHQLLLAVRPELVETSPFLQVLPLKLAHVEGFSPGFAHLRLWIARTASDRALPGGGADWLAAAACLALAAAGVAVRRTRAAALLAVAMLALWFLSASYDLRNAEPALCLFAAVAARTLRELRLAARGGSASARVAWAAVAAAWALLAVPGFAAVASGYRGTLFSRPGLAARRFADPEGRRRLFKPAADLVNVLWRAPYGEHAEHVIAGDRLYRLFGARGVCSRQLNGMNGTRPGDILLRGPSWMAEPPKPFRLAASLERSTPYHELWIAIGDDEFREARFSAAAGRLDVEDAPPCGLLELVPPAGTEADAAAVSCTNTVGNATLFARYVRPVAKGRTLRFLYWTGDGSPPRFAYSGPAPSSVRVWTPGRSEDSDRR